MNQREIAEKVTQIIRGDSFPAGVNPPFLAQAVRDYPLRGGKRVRPALVVWSALLHGGTAERALYPAAAVEVFHNWTLVHDDVIDRDDFRRGEPTCHRKVGGVLTEKYRLSPEEAARAGTDFAILAGDLQQAWANDLLLRSAEHGLPAATVLEMQKRMQLLAGRELISGEALDVDFSFRSGAMPDRGAYFQMIDGKTGALLALSLELGTLAALGPGTPELGKMNRLGLLAGRAFQLRDDYLGIFGDEKSFGKPVGADLKEGKATLLMIHALAHADFAAQKDLRAMADGKPCTESQLARARTIFTETGALAALEQEMRASLEEAQKILCAYADSPARRELAEFLGHLATRRT